jgi:hypothetical protein
LPEHTKPAEEPTPFETIKLPSALNVWAGKVATLTTSTAAVRIRIPGLTNPVLVLSFPFGSPLEPHLSRLSGLNGNDRWEFEDRVNLETWNTERETQVALVVNWCSAAGVGLP